MTREWFVVFADGGAEGPLWWRLLRRCLRPGFRHCFAFGPTEHGWVAVEWCFSGLHVDTIPQAVADGWLREAPAMGWTVLRTSARPCVRVRVAPTCAAALAALLGMARTPWLPATLYRHLLASGAVPISEAEPAWAACFPRRK